MLRRWIRQGMSTTSERRVNNWADELAQSADEPNVASKGPTDNIEPSTSHAQNAKSATMGEQTQDYPQVQQKLRRGANLSGNEPTKSAWIVNNGEWYQPTAPAPSLPAPPPRPTRPTNSSIPRINRNTRQQYDFSRVTIDSELSRLM